MGFAYQRSFLMFVQTGRETREYVQDIGTETKKAEALESGMVMTDYRMPLWTDKHNVTI